MSRMSPEEFAKQIGAGLLSFPVTHFSPDASAFAVVTQDIDSQGTAFRDQAAQIASVDTLETFMQDFRKHYDGAKATN